MSNYWNMVCYGIWTVCGTVLKCLYYKNDFRTNWIRNNFNNKFNFFSVFHYAILFINSKLELKSEFSLSVLLVPIEHSEARKLQKIVGRLLALPEWLSKDRDYGYNLAEDYIWCSGDAAAGVQVRRCNRNCNIKG